MNNYCVKVQVRKGKLISVGTGWFLRKDLVVTALHVISDNFDWDELHEPDGATCLLVGASDEKVILEPACFDARYDVALLKCTEPVKEAFAAHLFKASPEEKEWYANGYPRFGQGKELRYSGVVKFWRQQDDKLQLRVEDRPQHSWGGISGSAVRIREAKGAVAGLITDEIPDTDTLWATPVYIVEWLVKVYKVGRQAADLIGDDFKWNTDREALLEELKGWVDKELKVANLLEQVEELGKPIYDIQPFLRPQKPLQSILAPGTAPSLPNLFIGRDHDIDALRQCLSSEDPPTLITTVRGWPGIGKTTLAAALAHDVELQKTFPDGVLWAALGTSPNVLAELGHWLIALGDNPQHYPRPEERHNRLAALLRPCKMLLIIDDVWAATDAQPLLVGGQDCRTLITTREPEVARELGLPDRAIYQLLVLSETHSIELIRQLAPEVVKQNPKEVKELVQELEGLPLALKIAGGLLAAEAALGWGVSDLLSELAEGTRLLQEHAPSDRTELSNHITPTVAALFQKSTDRLDSETWGRFVLLGIFASKPATFDIPAIASTWGVVDPRPTIRELVKRGLLEPTDGGRFQMHALLTVHAKSMWETKE